MSIGKWLARKPQQFSIAEGLLMTGPKSQPPTFRAIRKMIGRLRRGDKPGSNGWSPWRSAKRVK